MIINTKRPDFNLQEPFKLQSPRIHWDRRPARQNFVSDPPNMNHHTYQTVGDGGPLFTSQQKKEKMSKRYKKLHLNKKTPTHYHTAEQNNSPLLWPLLEIFVYEPHFYRPTISTKSWLGWRISWSIKTWVQSTYKQKTRTNQSWRYN